MSLLSVVDWNGNLGLRVVLDVRGTNQINTFPPTSVSDGQLPFAKCQPRFILKHNLTLIFHAKNYKGGEGAVGFQLKADRMNERLHKKKSEIFLENIQNVMKLVVGVGLSKYFNCFQKRLSTDKLFLDDKKCMFLSMYLSNEH